MTEYSVFSWLPTLGYEPQVQTTRTNSITASVLYPTSHDLLLKLASQLTKCHFVNQKYPVAPSGFNLVLNFVL